MGLKFSRTASLFLKYFLVSLLCSLVFCFSQNAACVPGWKAVKREGKKQRTLYIDLKIFSYVYY